MGMRKRLKPYLSALTELGFEVGEVKPTGSAHFKVFVTAAGKQRWVLLPNSPSDRRAFLNWKSQIRYTLHELTGET